MENTSENLRAAEGQAAQEAQAEGATVHEMQGLFAVIKRHRSRLYGERLKQKDVRKLWVEEHLKRHPEISIANTIINYAIATANAELVSFMLEKGTTWKVGSRSVSFELKTIRKGELVEFMDQLKEESFELQKKLFEEYKIPAGLDVCVPAWWSEEKTSYGLSKVIYRLATEAEDAYLEWRGYGETGEVVLYFPDRERLIDILSMLPEAG
jgi:hypothetical protein